MSNSKKSLERLDSPLFFLNITLWFTFISISSCSQQGKDKMASTSVVQLEAKPETDSSPEQSEMEGLVGERNINWRKFEKVYSFVNSEGLGQKLGVNWLKSDSIEYQIASFGIMCDMELHGKAKNQFPNMDPEIDVDTSGTAYMVNEYTYSNDKYILSIRIETVKGQRARFTFTPQKSIRDEECDPNVGFLLRAATK